MSKEKLYQKIIAVMNEVGQLQKDGAVTDRSGKKMYNYLSEEQTTGELQRAFVKHQLVVFPIKVETEFFMIETTSFEKVTQAPVTKVLVTYKICDAETGEFEEIQSIGYGSDNQDKGSNKAMTGAFKYMQRQTFLISTGDDGDAQSSDELSAKYESRKTPPQAPPQGQTHNPSNNPSRPSTGQYNAPHSYKREAYKLREQLYMTWDELQSFAEAKLNRKLTKVTQLQDEKDWEIVVNGLQEYNKPA
jgi:hypothetical protein